MTKCVKITNPNTKPSIINFDPVQVSDDERQQAKQICYGMIYGIGSKSLGEQLGVVEEEASVFLSSFRETYPGVKRFMDATLTECREVFFVVLSPTFLGFLKTKCAISVGEKLGT